MIESYIVSLTAQSDVLPTFQHAGLDMPDMLEETAGVSAMATRPTGPLGRYLFFDGEAPHGPEEMVELPIRFICS